MKTKKLIIYITLIIINFIASVIATYYIYFFNEKIKELNLLIENNTEKLNYIIALNSDIKAKTNNINTINEKRIQLEKLQLNNTKLISEKNSLNNEIKDYNKKNMYNCK